ncbi:MAG: hypothetical protein ACP5IZ_12020, partial [Thermoprotei archaeon]
MKSKLNEKVKKLSALVLFELLILIVVLISILLDGKPLVPSLLSPRWLSILVIFNCGPLVLTFLERLWKLWKKFLVRLLASLSVLIVTGICISALVEWASTLASSSLVLILFLTVLLLA